MPLRIIKAGVLDLIQDTGRFGHTELGINPGGPMDPFAASMANSLVGNADNKPLLEIHFPGPQVLFTEDALVAITGADFSPTINNETVPLWHPVLVKKNTLLQFSAPKWGARAYIAAQGGLMGDRWLNSYATNVKGNMGGHKGRKLEKGDDIAFGYHELPFDALFKNEKDFQPFRWAPDVKDVYNLPHQIYFIAGNEYAALTDEAKQTLEQQPFVILPESDRMGYHLKSAPIQYTGMPEMISTAVSFGAMQLMPDGHLIVLMADHQTTGGYPRIGHVISAHLPKLAQLNAGEPIRFSTISLDEAVALFASQLQELANLRALCNDHLNQVLCLK